MASTIRDTNSEVNVAKLSHELNSGFTLEELQQKCIDKVEYLRDVFCKEFNIQIPDPKIVFNLTSRTIAGQAVYPHTIRFSNKFLLNEQQHYIDNIVGHELAHFIIFHLQERGILPRNIRAHGKEWRLLMIFFNIKPSTYHTYEVEPRTYRKGTKIFHYACSCQTVTVTESKHRKLVYGTRTMRCKKCGQYLEFKNKEIAK